MREWKNEKMEEWNDGIMELWEMEYCPTKLKQKSAMCQCLIEADLAQSEIRTGAKRSSPKVNQQSEIISEPFP
jgi:hypothetical protein